MAKRFVDVHTGEVFVSNERQLTGRCSLSLEKTEGCSLRLFAQLDKVSLLDNFQSTLTSVAGSVGNHFALTACGDHAVNKGTLERPNSVHALGGHQFSVNVFIAPTGADGNDVVVAACAAVNVVH